MEDMNQQLIANAICNIPDPEIPVINIQELGVLRQVMWDNGRLNITITPTYSGCPAMHAIEKDIRDVLMQHCVTDFEIVTVLHPAWTTDWMTEEARAKLKAYGIAPPLYTTADKNLITLRPKVIQCPRCGSAEVSLVSQFGSTACKALYKCIACMEPFDYFKCI